MSKPKISAVDLPATPVCYTCPYFTGTELQENACTRYAPKAVMLEESVKRQDVELWWPEVSSLDCCGEHPLMPEYIQQLRAKNVLRLGTKLTLSSDDAEAYKKAVDEAMSEF